MTPDSLKRLITLGVGVLLNLLAPKLGLSHAEVDGANTLIAFFLAQSGVNAAMAKFAASRAGQDIGSVMASMAKVKAALDQAKAAQAAQAGQSAGASPGSPSNS